MAEPKKVGVGGWVAAVLGYAAGGTLLFFLGRTLWRATPGDWLKWIGVAVVWVLVMWGAVAAHEAEQSGRMPKWLSVVLAVVAVIIMFGSVLAGWDGRGWD